MCLQTNTATLNLQKQHSNSLKDEYVFWDVEQCSLVNTDRHFREAYCLRHQCVPDDEGTKLP
jgi:hypothetical protein